MCQAPVTCHDCISWTGHGSFGICNNKVSFNYGIYTVLTTTCNQATPKDKDG